MAGQSAWEENINSRQGNRILLEEKRQHESNAGELSGTVLCDHQNKRASFTKPACFGQPRSGREN
jgi:hypothetical protein